MWIGERRCCFSPCSVHGSNSKADTRFAFFSLFFWAVSVSRTITTHQWMQFAKIAATGLGRPRL